MLTRVFRQAETSPNQEFSMSLASLALEAQCGPLPKQQVAEEKSGTHFRGRTWTAFSRLVVTSTITTY